MIPSSKKLIILALFLVIIFSLIFIKIFQNKESSNSYLNNTCASKEDRSDRIGCWERTVETILKEKGVDEALELLQAVKKTDLMFSSDCHVYAHLIGQLSYWEYISDGDFTVDDESKLCDYGFYHGFMQEMGHHEESFLESSTKLCNLLVDKVDSVDKENALNQCFHGIGHGVTFFYIDEFPNQELEITSRGIEYCKKIVKEGDRRKDCVFGIYAGISSLYFGTHSYLWPIKENDPFWICDFQPYEFQQGCFVGLVPAIFSHWEFDLQSGMDKIKSIKNITYAKETAFYSGQTLSHKIIIGAKTKEEIISLCQSLDRNLNLECIGGVSKGILHYSLGYEAEGKSKEFCESTSLTKVEKEVCFSEKN